MPKKLSETPLIHPSAQVTQTKLGKYTEIDEGCIVAECEIGDYSYLIRQTEAWCATIGKFANIASHVRINRRTTRLGALLSTILPIVLATILTLRKTMKTFSNGAAIITFLSAMMNGSATEQRSSPV